MATSAPRRYVTFHYVAWNEVQGEMDIGSYTGNAADNRSITGVGFPPELVIVKNVTTDAARAPPSVAWTSSPTRTANFTATANANGPIQALQTDGFQVGTNAEANENATVHFYAAWARAQQPILITGDYKATRSTTARISGLGFQPDVVIIKGDVTQVAVIRTSTMTGDVSKPLTGATVLDREIDPVARSVRLHRRNQRDGQQQRRLPLRAPRTIHRVQGRPRRDEGGHVHRAIRRAASPITGIGFSPELVFIIRRKRHEADPLIVRVDGQAHNFGTGAGTAAAGIIALTADGFTVGTNDTSVNPTASVYHYVAWNEIPGQMEVGTYAGNNGRQSRTSPASGSSPSTRSSSDTAPRRMHQFPASLGRSTDTSLGFIANATITPGNNDPGAAARWIPDRQRDGDDQHERGELRVLRLEAAAACGADPHRRAADGVRRDALRPAACC